jgi:predicted lipoprotein with Yx(FWY)xxD motif
MKKSRILVALIGLLALLVLPAAAMHHEVKLAEKAGIGQYLTDSEGMTLYWFKKDSPGQSTCTGGCVDKWPLFFRENVAPPTGLNANEFESITREDGVRQTLFRGFPLYYFKGDAAKGDTKGNDMMDVWYVVNPAKFPPE